MLIRIWFVLILLSLYIRAFHTSGNGTRGAFSPLTFNGGAMVQEFNGWNFTKWPIVPHTSLPKATPYLIIVMVHKANIMNLFGWTAKLGKDFTVIILDDDVHTNDLFTNLYEGKYLVRIKDKYPQKHQYRNLNFFKGRISTWDKAIFFVSEIIPFYQFIWIFQQDVWIPSLKSFLTIHEKAQNLKADFVSSRTTTSYSGEEIAPHLKFIWTRSMASLQHFELPYYRGIPGAIGLNQNFINIIKEFKNKRHKLEYFEIFFYTLINKYPIKSFLTSELQFLDTYNTTKQWTCEKATKNGLRGWYYPVKNAVQFARQCISQGKWSTEIALQLLEVNRASEVNDEEQQGRRSSRQ